MSDLEDGISANGEAAQQLPSVGELLAAARQARGLEIVEIAQALKLGPRQVEALESGDWQALPGQTFIRGFVRNYARLVGIDAGQLMAMLDDVLEKPAGSLVVPPSHQGAMPHAEGPGAKRDRVVMVAGGALVVLALLAYFLMPGSLSLLRDNAQGLLDSLARHDEPVTVQAPMSAEPVFPPGATPQQIMNPQAVLPPLLEEPVAAGATVTPNEAPVGEAPALRFVVDQESWLEVRDRDNRLILSQRQAAGTEQVLSGQVPLTLTIGYAPGVRLFWQGKAVDLAPHTKGDVARLVLE
jgi:cytoskeleton protein RodZ